MPHQPAASKPNSDDGPGHGIDTNNPHNQQQAQESPYLIQQQQLPIPVILHQYHHKFLKQRTLTHSPTSQRFI